MKFIIMIILIFITIGNANAFNSFDITQQKTYQSEKYTLSPELFKLHYMRVTKYKFNYSIYNVKFKSNDTKSLSNNIYGTNKKIIIISLKKIK